MLGQFHQEKKHVIWMFKNGPGGYWIENHVKGFTSEKRNILSKQEMLGKWNDVLVNVKWTHKEDGFFKVKHHSILLVIFIIRNSTKPKRLFCRRT